MPDRAVARHITSISAQRARTLDKGLRQGALAAGQRAKVWRQIGDPLEAGDSCGLNQGAIDDFARPGDGRQHQAGGQQGLIRRQNPSRIHAGDLPPRDAEKLTQRQTRTQVWHLLAGEFGPTARSPQGLGAHGPNGMQSAARQAPDDGRQTRRPGLQHKHCGRHQGIAKDRIVGIGKPQPGHLGLVAGAKRTKRRAIAVVQPLGGRHKAQTIARPHQLDSPQHEVRMQTRQLRRADTLGRHALPVPVLPGRRHVMVAHIGRVADEQGPALQGDGHRPEVTLDDPDALGQSGGDHALAQQGRHFRM